jgi:hypothetical protein
MIYFIYDAGECRGFSASGGTCDEYEPFTQLIEIYDRLGDMKLFKIGEFQLRDADHHACGTSLAKYADPNSTYARQRKRKIVIPIFEKPGHAPVASEHIDMPRNFLCFGRSQRAASLREKRTGAFMRNLGTRRDKNLRYIKFCGIFQYLDDIHMLLLSFKRSANHDNI